MAELIQHNGRPAIYANGNIYPPMMMTINTYSNNDRFFNREYYRDLGKAGIRIFFIICDTDWLKPGAFELFREEAELILDEIPEACIIPRIGLHPNNKWIEEHPEECIKYSDGSIPAVMLETESYSADLPHHYSLCSEKWREDAGIALAETWNKIMALPYADHIIGCFLAAGGTSEWYYLLPTFNADKRICLDHSEAFKRNFTKYLTEKYKTDEELQKQWKNPNATLNDPPIPGFEKHYYVNKADDDAGGPAVIAPRADLEALEKNPTSIGTIANVDANMDIYDFYRAWNIGTADSVIHFAKIIKDMTPDKLVGAFYGSHGCTNYIRCGTCGGTVKVLKSPYLDFLAAPGVYENRLAGGFEGEREMHDSFALNNKIYIVEQDTRTHEENAFHQNKYNVFDMTDTINIMKREFGRNIAEDTHAWWFDQIIGGKRYSSAEAIELITRQQIIAKESYELDRTKNAEIAFIFDEESTQLVSEQSTFDLVEMLRNYEIARIGAPVDQYYHNDITDPAMPDYKLYVFVNMLTATAEERKAIHEKLRKNNATAVWLWASGIFDPEAEKKLSTENIKALTGFDVEMDNAPRTGKYRIEVGSHECVKMMQPRFLYGYRDRKRDMAVGNKVEYESSMYPAFYPTEGDVCASFVTNGKPAITVKAADGFTSIFHGSKSIRSDTLRSFAAYAGCHIYCDSDDVLYTGKNYITVHSSSNGLKTIRFPKKCTLVEVYENKVYAEDIYELTIDMYLGETKMFRIIWNE